MKSHKIKNFDSVERYSPDYKYGLSDSQVQSRKEDGLINKTKAVVGKSSWEIIASNLFPLFNVILYIIAALIIFGGYYDSLFFLGILLCNIIIGLYEDFNARRLMAKLRILTQAKVVVIRDGQEIEIPSSEIVLDDIVVFSRDSQICIDGTVLSGSLAVNESFLTGESQNIFKQVGDQVLSGSFVASGKAYVKADKVGEMCFVETLQGKAKQFKRSPSVILKSLRKLFRVLVIIVAVMTALMLLMYGLQGRLSSVQGFKIVIGPLSGALISMIPSGLYLLTSVSLATAVISLAGKKAQVQDFYSVEMLARVNVLCVDKTGTITDGKMKVKNIEIFDESFKEDQIKQIVSNILIATGDDNITAQALKEYFNYSLTANVSKALPFNSDNKYSAASFKAGNTYILGAAEYINLENKQSVLRKVGEYASKGLRVLVLGKSNKEIENEKVVDIVSPIGLIILTDNIKPDAIKTFKWFKENNVAIKVISGDSAQTVSEIAKQAGIENAERYVSLESMSVEEVKLIADKYTVFGRVNPEQKEALVISLKEQGKTVGMTGDGVNDILALKRADCSIAMASGAEASRNVSHIVLLDSNFDHLPEVVAEGRRVINNLQRTASLFLTKTTFAVLTSLAFILTYFFTMNADIIYPFRTNHLYMWETIALGIAAFFLALQPNSEIIEGSFMKNILKKALPAGIACGTAALIPFLLAFMESKNLFFLDLGTPEKMTGVAVIAFTLLGLLVLGKVCYPFDKYRILVLIFAIVGDIALFSYGMIMTLTGHENFSLIHVRFDQLTAMNYFTAVVIAISIGILYIGTTHIVRVIRKGKSNANI